MPVESAKSVKRVGSAKSVRDTNSRIVLAMWIMRAQAVYPTYQVECIQLVSKGASTKKRKERKEAVLNFQRSKRSRLDGEELRGQRQGQGTFKHFMCGECFKPLENGVIPDEHTCKCV